MLFLLDSNILLYAKVGTEAEHTKVSSWLTDTLRVTRNRILICETSILAFLRIATNVKVYDPPLPVSEAKEFLRALLEHPSVQLFQTSGDFFQDLAGLMEQHQISGSSTMDAHLAAIALYTGATLVSRDRDFRSFPYLTTVNQVDD
jgi:toxin-antitoxin system PIN domain toxin